ncbi:MAG: MogA/MoaB family molybdenum cofactor biosynthesis protein [Desulfurococcales archaeon]|nr:MogA/MoaB family molybdenum cofactor biosynthesis protein [Desulfurococcales archaeon]MEB3789102.1 MogA/MoaB family molybdenum cofactor biosynthesis protein [Desulfurococcales archaeon]
MRSYIRYALVVTSDRVKKGIRKDKIRPMLEEWLEYNNGILVYYKIVGNKVSEIVDTVKTAVTYADVVLVTGGTGPGPRDKSIEAVELVAEKRLEGLGEEHRFRSRKSVGLRASISRVSGYTLGESLIVVTPGSPDAVKVMLDILSEIAHHIVEALRGASHWDRHLNKNSPH